MHMWARPQHNAEWTWARARVQFFATAGRICQRAPGAGERHRWCVTRVDRYRFSLSFSDLRQVCLQSNPYHQGMPRRPCTILPGDHSCSHRRQAQRMI
eukprot:scaffold10414_cov59-Phaeocystis_antarctica.AAC.1